MTCIKERIIEIAKNKGVGVEEFAGKIGMAYSSFKGNAKYTPINSDAIASILTLYADVNAEWLITGEGEMTGINKNFLYKDEQNRELRAIPSNKGIPLIPLDAIAGFSNSESTTVMEYECEKYVIPNFQGAEFLIQVKGSSMYPKYSSGDIVACKKLSLDTFFQWNKVYVLNTEQGVLIKRIKPTKSQDHILCVSDNEKYDPFELHKKDILSVSIVIGVIRLE